MIVCYLAGFPLVVGESTDGLVLSAYDANIISTGINKLKNKITTVMLKTKQFPNCSIQCYIKLKLILFIFNPNKVEIGSILKYQ